MSLKSIKLDNAKAIEMSKQLEEAKTDEDRHRIANSDLYMVASIDDRDVFYHEAIWTKFNKRLIPSGKLVYHKDGNPINNDPDNLDLVDENKDYGDLHQENNKIFHEQNIDQNKNFIRIHFQDIYEVLFGTI